LGRSDSVLVIRQLEPLWFEYKVFPLNYAEGFTGALAVFGADWAFFPAAFLFFQASFILRLSAFFSASVFDLTFALVGAGISNWFFVGAFSEDPSLSGA